MTLNKAISYVSIALGMVYMLLFCLCWFDTSIKIQNAILLSLMLPLIAIIISRLLFAIISQPGDSKKEKEKSANAWGIMNNIHFLVLVLIYNTLHIGFSIIAVVEIISYVLVAIITNMLLIRINRKKDSNVLDDL